MQNQILETYQKERERISRFLVEKKKTIDDKQKIFFELLFCISVPQSKAPVCRACLEELMKNKILLTANEKQLSLLLKGIRFQNNKARFIIEARKKFDDIYKKIHELKSKPKELRKWLHDNIKGIGMKEASHFMRNIGLGEDFAILDVHIRRTMQELGLIKETVLTRKKYFEYEKIFQDYAKKLGMKPAELDITIWLMQSGNTEMM